MRLQYQANLWSDPGFSAAVALREHARYTCLFSSESEGIVVLIRALFLLAIILSGVGHADSFDVQIGAYRNPDNARIDLPANVGELRSILGPSGLTRFVVGPFANRAEAELALARLEAAGFGDAFIRVTQDGSTAASRSALTQTAVSYTKDESVADQRSDASSVSQRDLDIFMSLSEEERRDLVFLDGRLHKKVGDEFIPYRD